MNRMIYLATGLFIVSLLLVTDSSFAGTAYHRSAVMNWNAIEASSFIGSQVFDIRGYELGQIDCFTVDPESGRISTVVLSDVPKMGARQVALPFASFTRVGANLFVYNPPGEVYSFEGEAPFWSDGNYPYYGNMPPEAYYNRDCQLIGADVQTSDGVRIARIDDLVIDFETGHVAYAVLSDFGGMETRMVAVPYTLSTVREGVVIVSVDRDKLLAAPAFVWPHTHNWRFVGDVYLYYGIHPYWESDY
jgi:sporulation protein YlmC with PRC-barrel domain